jgi:hypothetical protein
MATSPYHWHRQTIQETFERICAAGNTTPWVAIGDFLDDWRRSAVEHRRELVTTPTPFKMRNIFGGDRMLDRI